MALPEEITPPAAPREKAGATVAATVAGTLAVDRPNAAGSPASPALAIDGYTIVRQLGEGGMGAVYEARQESTGRRVAIKVMLESALSSEAARKRFEREVEVVARLEHPGIVSIIDSGVRRGQYYFVMEFVEGRPLDQMMEPGACDVRTALACVADVCDVVDYAHQRAILHRDLKPPNVLMEASGRVRLLDFGIAQVLDDAAKSRETISRAGQVVGTVAYMSPEQAAGKVHDLSVRTDVYALGAIAYELLTGRLPFPHEGSITQMLLRIANEPVRPPSSIARGLSRDVDAILLKALEKQASLRYATAGELGADLRRYLAGETVLARPVGTAGRTWRWVKRNRLVSAVAAASVALLVTISSGLLWRIVSERDRAVQNYQLLKGVLESADPETEGGTIPQLMDRTAKGLDQTPPEDVRSEADIREILGGVYRKFGLYSQAIANQSRVLEIREEAGGDDPLVADAMHNLAATLWWDGQYARAETLYVGALAMRQRLYRDDHAAIAFSLTHLAACRLRMGNLESARSLYVRALDMRVRLYGPEHEQVAQSLNNLAKFHLETGAMEEAEASFRQALAMIRKLRGDEFHGTASTSANLGECLLLRARGARLDGKETPMRALADEALALYKRAKEIRAAKFTTGYPLAAVELGIARALLLLGDAERAGEAARHGMQMLIKAQIDHHPDYLELLAANAEASARLGASLEAQDQYEKAIARTAALRANADAKAAELSSELGELRFKRGERTAGLELMRAASAQLTAKLGDQSLAAREAAARLARAESEPRPTD